MDIFIGGVSAACRGRREVLMGEMKEHELAAFPDLGLEGRITLEILRGPALAAAFRRQGQN